MDFFRRIVKVLATQLGSRPARYAVLVGNQALYHCDPLPTVGIVTQQDIRSFRATVGRRSRQLLGWETRLLPAKRQRGALIRMESTSDRTLPSRKVSFRTNLGEANGPTDSIVAVVPSERRANVTTSDGDRLPDGRRSNNVLSEQERLNLGLGMDDTRGR